MTNEEIIEQRRSVEDAAMAGKKIKRKLYGMNADWERVNSIPLYWNWYMFEYAIDENRTTVPFEKLPPAIKQLQNLRTKYGNLPISGGRLMYDRSPRLFKPKNEWGIEDWENPTEVFIE